MHIIRLDHVNLRTSQLGTMIDWYVDVLGLTNGDRPDFGVPGAWLYAGDVAVVHLVEVTHDQGVGSEGELKLEHFALRGRDADGFEARLQAQGVGFQKSGIDALNLVAFNIWDPDGNHIHVDFTEPH